MAQMPPNMISDNEYLDSRFADTIKVAYKLGPQNGADIGLARASVKGKRSRAWRITLGRVERNDGHSFQSGNSDPNGASPLWKAQDVSFAASIMNTPQIPPRRGNPIFGTNSPGNASDIEPIWVQINWGMENGRTYRMLGNWPMLGGSVVVEGSWVEVFGGVAVFGFGAPPITSDEFPVLTAQIVPTSGLASTDAGELSIQQRVNLAATNPLVGGMQPVTDGVVAQPGFNSAALGVRAAMPASAVYNVGPFVGWNATLRVLNPFKPPPQLVIFCAATVPQFELRDNQVPNGAGVFVASPGNVGIVYRTDGVTGVHTIADLEALLNTSTLIQIATPDPNTTLKVFAGWTIAANHVPAATGLGTLTFVAPTAGGAVYVPDFARRVRVWPAQQNVFFAGAEFRVPFEGPEPMQLNWYDDSGVVVDVAWIGLIRDPLTGNVTSCIPPGWHPVPARATTLAIYQISNTFNTPDTAFVHWRIAP